MRILDLLLIISVVSAGFAGQQGDPDNATASVVIPAIDVQEQIGRQEVADSRLTSQEVNEREFDLMSEALAGNVWLPGGSEQVQQEKQQFHQELIELGEKVDQVLVSDEDKARYLEMKLRSIQNRIEMIEYYHRRVAEVKLQTGVVLIPDEVVQQGNAEIVSLQGSVEQLQDKLWN
ncbi:MAG: hypothetical protein HOM11_02975 [Methylococcales bacterium]|jgi:hypothetical protein|nr:hypothetical protein [Methylococcales bacterium]MBT7442685.1 hypothetical protein [Methylococcales bacterium]